MNIETIRRLPPEQARAALATLPPILRNLSAYRELAQEIERGPIQATPAPAPITPTQSTTTASTTPVSATRRSEPSAEQVARTRAVYDWTQAQGYPSEILWDWVWIEFASKPDAATIANLKTHGFRWVKLRGRWAHDCGHKSKRGRGDPRDKYGNRERERETAAA